MFVSSKYVPLSESFFSVNVILSRINFLFECLFLLNPVIPNFDAATFASFTDISIAGLNPFEPIGSLPNE